MNRFEYTDPTGNRLEIAPAGDCAISFESFDGTSDYYAAAVKVPCDRVEEVIAGIRDMARQAGGQHVHRLGNPDDDGGILDDWDNCRDPECPGPTTAEHQALAGAPITAEQLIRVREVLPEGAVVTAGTLRVDLGGQDITAGLADPEAERQRAKAVVHIDETLAAGEPDNPAALALAQHIADHPISTVQAAFRKLGMRLAFELSKEQPC